MQPTSRAVAVVKDYAGLVTNTGSAAADPSSGQADELVNLAPLRQGELAVRPGYRVVQFDDED